MMDTMNINGFGRIGNPFPRGTEGAKAYDEFRVGTVDPAKFLFSIYADGRDGIS